MGEHRITASYGTDAMLINYNLNYDLSAAKMKTLSPMGSRAAGKLGGDTFAIPLL